MSHELKFNVGSRVRIIEDRWADSCSHDCQLGSIHIIASATLESREGEDACDYQEYKLDNGAWVAEFEIEAVS